MKKMEELGIGRPSTYASIVTTIQDRGYVRKDKNRLIPEDKGRLVTAFLMNYFRKYVGYEFTAELENELDEVSAGDADYKDVARVLAIPHGQDSIKNELLESYRIKNGVLHNPRHDRRTTKGTFHVCDDGLPIPGDKKSVPRSVFAKLLASALTPPDKYLKLPFSEGMESPANSFVTLYLRPLVRPEVPGVSSYKNMEVRFSCPGR